jgi:hypothetical protein
MKTITQYIEGEYPMFVFDNGAVAPCGEWGKDVLHELNTLRKVAQIAQDGMIHISMSAEREYNYTERIEKLLNSIA